MAGIKKICVLICSMPISAELAIEIKDLCPALILCLDAGYLTAEKYKIPCDMVLGDFDSPGMQDVLPKIETIRFPSEKDYTDSLIGIMEGIQQGCSEFYIFGGLGGRQDHNYHNINMLLYLKEHGANGYLIDETTRITLIENESISLSKREGYKLSVFAMCQDAYGVTERGVKYPLTEAHLKLTVPIGISNEFQEDTAQIDVTQGKLLIILSKDH